MVAFITIPSRSEMENLPDDCLLQIIEMLPVDEQMNASLVSRRWASLVAASERRWSRRVKLTIVCPFVQPSMQRLFGRKQMQATATVIKQYWTGSWMNITVEVQDRITTKWKHVLNWFRHRCARLEAESIIGMRPTEITYWRAKTVLSYH